MNFNGERLRVLRRFHNHSQRALSECIGVTPAAVAKYERGGTEPSEIVLNAMAEVLQVQPAFFYYSDKIDVFRDSETNFRSRKTAMEGLRKQIRSHGTLLGMLMNTLSTCIVWPPFKLPRVHVQSRLSESKEEAEREKRRINEQLEGAAEACRIAIGIGTDAPIDNVTAFAEHAGVVVTTLDTSVTEKIDAFSRYGTTSIAVINPARPSAARRRFDLAHEIGHGVAHVDTPAGSDDAREHDERERQAEYFAGALLMPRDVFAREFWNLGSSPSWPHLFDMKRRWGVHLPALVLRANQLGVMNHAEYARRFRYMSKMGWRKPTATEPAEGPYETPQLFSLGLRRYLQETGKTRDELANDLSWLPPLFDKVVGASALPDTPSSERDGIASMDAFRKRKMA